MLVAVTLLLAQGLVSPMPGTNRALLVRIVEYGALKGAPQFSTASGQLFASLSDTQDIEAMQSLLSSSYRFSPENIVVLENEEATQAGIVQALQDIAVASQPGDNVVFYYTGHGYEQADRQSGPREALDPIYKESRDEVSGKDQVLVVSPEGEVTEDSVYLRDDVISNLTEILSERVGAEGSVTLLFDCCHSGSMTRNSAGRVKGSTYTGPAASTGDVDPSRPTPDNVVAFFAAREGEETLSTDFGGVQMGLFTYYFSTVTTRLGSARPEGPSVGEVFDAVYGGMTSRARFYIPLLEGRRTRRLFGGGNQQGEGFAVVTQPPQKAATLNWGALRGIVEGAQFGLFESDRLGEAEHEIGTAVVTQVGLLSSIVSIEAHQGRERATYGGILAVPKPGRLILSPLKVAAEGSSDLQTLIGEIPFAALSEIGTEGAVAVVESEGRYLIHWNGDPEAEGGEVTQVETVNQLRDSLRNEWRWRSIAAMPRNEDLFTELHVRLVSLPATATISANRAIVLADGSTVASAEALSEFDTLGGVPVGRPGDRWAVVAWLDKESRLNLYSAMVALTPDGGLQVMQTARDALGSEAGLRVISHGRFVSEEPFGLFKLLVMFSDEPMDLTGLGDPALRGKTPRPLEAFLFETDGLRAPKRSGFQDLANWSVVSFDVESVSGR